MSRIRRHFQNYASKPPWTFCWHATIEGLIVSLLLVSALSIFMPVEERSLLHMPPEELLLVAVVLAPLVETLLFQSLPVFLARLFKAGTRGQLLAGMIPFALAHLTEGVGTFLGAGLAGGFYLSFCYVHWRQRSRWTAFWTTVAQHAMRNGAAVLIVWAAGGLHPAPDNPFQVPPSYNLR